MFKYYTKAVVFKLFSINKLTISFYRKLGNLIAPIIKIRLNMSSWKNTKNRGDLLINLIEKYDCIKEKDNVFEMGTGWFHFYSIYIRIFYDVSITMFDIWDNRQWSVFKSNFKRLKSFDYSNKKNRSILKFLNVLNNCASFNDLYKELNLNYIINNNGSISNLEDNSYDLIISFHVLEHIPQNSIDNVLYDFHRVLKPGGYCIHQIGYSYGQTSYNWIALQHGHIGAILYFLILIRCLIMCRNSFYKNQEPYWVAYSFGALGFSFVMIFLGLVYASTIFHTDMVSLLYFYVIAVLELKRSKWSTNQLISKGRGFMNRLKREDVN